MVCMVPKYSEIQVIPFLFPGKESRLSETSSQVSVISESLREGSRTHGIGSGQPMFTSVGRPQDRLARTPHNGVNPCSHEAQGPSVDPRMPGRPTEGEIGGLVSSADAECSRSGLKESLRRPPYPGGWTTGSSLRDTRPVPNGRFCSW